MKQTATFSHPHPHLSLPFSPHTPKTLRMQAQNPRWENVSVFPLES